MPTYTVKLFIQTTNEYTIEATCEEAALDEAQNRYHSGQGADVEGADECVFETDVMEQPKTTAPTLTIGDAVWWTPEQHNGWSFRARIKDIILSRKSILAEDPQDVEVFLTVDDADWIGNTDTPDANTVIEVTTLRHCKPRKED